MRKNRLFWTCIIFVLLLNYDSIALTDSNSSNNMKNISINVYETSNIKVLFVPVENTFSDFDEAVEDLSSFLGKSYPVADGAIITYKSRIPIEITKSTTLNANDRKNILKEISKFASSSGYDYGIGVVEENWFKNRTDRPNTTGITNRDIQNAALVDAAQRKTVAHELGHVVPFNLCDEYSKTKWETQNSARTDGCPNAKNVSSFRQICEDNNGCPAYTYNIVFPYEDINYSTTLRNFMGGTDNPSLKESGNSFNFQSWVSNETFEILLNESKELASQNVSQCLVFEAEVDRSNNIAFRVFYILRGFICKVFESESGEYNLQTHNSSGGIVSNISFDVEFQEYGEGGNVTELNSTTILFAIPFNDDINRINILYNNTLKDERNVTPNTPFINVTYPTGNELLETPFNITWNATDADNDSIYYAVLISDDGGENYTTLDIDVNQSYYELDPDDDFGHGTHVAGIIASTDSTYKGVAYGSQIVAVKAIKCGHLTT